MSSTPSTAAIPTRACPPAPAAATCSRSPKAHGCDPRPANCEQKWGVLTNTSAHSSLEVFAKEVGDSGPVTCVGGRTQWDVGGAVDPAAREVRAPAGIVTFEPAEMVVRVRAGTTVAELDAALAEGGQMVPLDPVAPERATVGGVLSVGRSGIRRLRYGPIRDTLLEARFVSSDGKLVKAGGPVVKNVSGYDLCRLLVGSLGTLGFIGGWVLRTLPRPAVSQWFAGRGDPLEVRRRLFRPSCLLWDGDRIWARLEGRGGDVEPETRALGPGFDPVDGPPTLPRYRRSVRPLEVPNGLATGEVAEVGIGTIHTPQPP